MELEELIASEHGEVFGSEALRDTPRSPKSRKTKSKKIQYTKRADDSRDATDDSHSKKSARSRRSRISRTSARTRKKSVDKVDKNDDIGSKSPKITRSPKVERSSTKERRKINYRSREPETPEERERETRSYRSKDTYRSKESKASGGNLRRSGHRKTKADSEREDSNKGKKSTRPSTSEEISKQKSWPSFDDFNSDEWSSSSSEDEGDVEVRLNDEGVPRTSIHSTGSGGEQRPRSRRQLSRKTSSIERTSQRSSSGNGLEISGRRRLSRRGSSGGIDAGMVLGDPSRRAPPIRTKSVDLSAPTRTNSGNFADYLSKQGLTNKSDRSTSRTQYSSSLESNGHDDNDNPFEVIQHQSFALPDNWDPFASEDTVETGLDGTSRSENLHRSRSGALLQLSSKDTISRLPAGANVRKTFHESNHMAVMSHVIADINELGDREKQRRADYKKSIAAAAMAGRRLSMKNGKKPTRQVRTVRSSSYGENLGQQLEGVLQSAR